MPAAIIARLKTAFLMLPILWVWTPLATAATALKAAKSPDETAKAAAELAKQTGRSLELVQALAVAGSRQSTAEVALVQASAAKAAAPQAAASAQTRSKPTALAIQAARDAVQRAEREKAAADKVLAEKRAPIDAALARAQALKTEFDALSAESKRSGASKGGLAAVGPSGPQAKR